MHHSRFQIYVRLKSGQFAKIVQHISLRFLATEAKNIREHNIPFIFYFEILVITVCLMRFF